MNKTKKLASLLLALVMAFALAMPAFALPSDYTDNDPEYDTNDADQLQPSDTGATNGTKPSTDTDCSITIDGAKEGHTYNAYQIFGGDLLVTETKDDTGKVTETTKTLSNITWGNGITPTGQTAVLAEYTCTTPAEVADKLTNAEQAEEFANFLLSDSTYLQNSATLNYENGEYSASNLKPGYYLIKDQYTAGANQDKDDAVSANIMQVLGNEIMKPKAETPPLDKTITGVDTDTSKDQDAISAEIGKKVNFELASKVPEITGYTDKYTYEIHDTMSSGLTFNDDVVFKIGNATLTEDVDFEVVDPCTTEGHNGCIKIVAKNLLSYIKENDIKAGTDITVTYSATVNDAALATDVETNTAKLVYSNNPYQSTSTGETPPSTVYVYDFDITIFKYDGKDEDNKTPLAGAQFVLKKSDTGYYKWNDTTKKVEWIDSETDAILTTDANGRLDPNAFKGLEAGTYTLHEVKAPDGYNTLKGDYTITITENFKKDDQGQPTKEVESYTIEVKDWDDNLVGKKDADGNVQPEVINVADHKGSPAGTQLTQNIDVPNNSGALLPETGGIGTTIFYVVGGVLAAGAVILLITKRRMNIDK